MHAVMFNKHLMSSKNYKLAVVCFAHRLQQSLLKGFYILQRFSSTQKFKKSFILHSNFVF